MLLVSKLRKLTPRYEKTDRSYLGLAQLAAAMITLNKIIVIYGEAGKPKIS